MIAKDRIILGVDPGTQVMGFGLLSCYPKPLVLQAGILKLDSKTSHPLRLKKIFEFLGELILAYHPDELAIEAPFFGKNVQSMLKLGRAQGVAIAAALQHNIPVTEYAPRKVKQSITGNGNASKEQVAAMIQQLLNYRSVTFLDASDALAVALCHYYQNAASKGPIAYSGWQAFIKSNPKRIK